MKNKNMISFEQYREAAEAISKKSSCRPRLGIILGSGLSALADYIEEPITIAYSEIPHFPRPTAIGHKGNLILGKLENINVVALQGRFHYYEGYPMEWVTFPIRVLKLLGIDTLFVSNAAGGINPDMHVGDLMLIRDHINFLPNPLIGPNAEEFGARFPDMTKPYDPSLLSLAETIAENEKIEIKKGVYVGLTGPSYETPSEYRFFRFGGGDAIGMSTIPEVIVARHTGIRVLGISVITNEGWHDEGDFTNDAEDVLRQANLAGERIISIFRGVVRSMD